MMLRYALGHADSGRHVFPIHTPKPDGGCDCARGKECSSVGKHPRTKNGFKDATTDPEEIRRRWKMWPTANIGIATGASGLAVVDVDKDHGGFGSLAALLAENDPFPETVSVRTGGGGQHFYFAAPASAPIRNSASELGAGIDIRALGGYVVAPPSLHASGERYAWSGEPGDVAPLPEWLTTRLTAPSPRPTGKAAPGDPIAEGVRNDTLASLAGSLRALGMDEAAIRAALLVINDERCRPPLGEAEVQGIAASVAKYPPGRQPQVSVTIPSTTWPEPLAEDAFHGLAGSIVRAIEPHSEADPVALLGQLLVAFGNAVGHGPHFMAEGDRHALNLYLVLVAETSKGRKGTSWGRVRQSFEGVDEEWLVTRIQSGSSSGEGIIWAVRDPIEKEVPVKKKGKTTGYQTEIVDQGVEDKRLLLHEGEYASTLRVLARDGNTLSATLRKAFDNGNLRILTKNSPAAATDAHVSIVGHITKTELNRYLTTTEASNGFGNRHLWLCARRSKLLPEGGGEVAELPQLRAELREALAFGRTIGELCRDDNARKIWHEVYGPLSEGKPGLLGAMTARAEAIVMRLACIYALLDCSDVIRAEHLTAALAFWDYAEASAGFVFGDSLGDPDADAILRGLRRSPSGLSRTDISNLFGRNSSRKNLDRALGVLLETGLARFEKQETEGRAAEVWHAATN